MWWTDLPKDQGVIVCTRQKRLTNRQIKRWSIKGGSQNMFANHLILAWPKTAENRNFCFGEKEGWINGPMDEQTDRPTLGRTN